MKETSGLKKKRGLEVAADKEKGSLWKRIVILAAILLITFLSGLIPMWLLEEETARQRDAAQEHLRLSQLQNRLAAAAINARHGEYEPARVAASDFYTDLRGELARPESAFTERQRENVKPILQERDEIITLLARSDQAAGDRLADLYLIYLQAVNSPVQQ